MHIETQSTGQSKDGTPIDQMLHRLSLGVSPECKLYAFEYVAIFKKARFNMHHPTL